MSRYSRLSIPEQDLLAEAQHTQNFFNDLEVFWKEGHADPLIVLQIYMTTYQVLRTKKSPSFQNRLPIHQRAPRSKNRAEELKHWILDLASGTQKLSPTLAQTLKQELQFLFSEYNFISIPGEVALQLNHLNHFTPHDTHELSDRPNTRPLHVIDSIPTPLDLLKLQSRGQRVVTLHFSFESRKKFVDTQRDCFEFALHDLSHAYKFFHSGSFDEQLRFFQLFEGWMQKDPSIYNLSEPELKKGLEYVMSDMNSHPKHLLQTLNAHLSLSHKSVPHDLKTQFDLLIS